MEESKTAGFNKDKYKPYMFVLIILMIIISTVFLYVMTKNSYYIKNHPCEICIKKYGSTCYLNGASYSWNDEKKYIESYKSILPPVQKDDNEIDFINEKELDKLFEGIKENG